MARPKSKGAYAPLAANYYMDDSILEVGPDAELLFVRCLSFLASIPSDGFITDRQVRTIVGLGLRTVPKRLEALRSAGLLEAVEGGYVARSWLKWNKSTEQIGKLLAKDRERKALKDGENQPNSERNDGGIHSDSEEQNSTEQYRTEQRENVAEIRPDVSRLCELLAGLIAGNGSKRPTIVKGWLDAARLMIDNDKRPLTEAVALIQWCQADPFWRGNILSMPKFRDKYDTLRLQREAKTKAATPESTRAPRRVVSGRAH